MQNKESKILVQKTEISAGPIPHPDILQKYESVLTGSADRILKMAEKQSLHRMELEKKALKSNSISELLGLIFGFILAFSLISIGGFLIYNNKHIEGLTSIISTLVGLVSVFIYGKKSQKEERLEKMKFFNHE